MRKIRIDIVFAVLIATLAFVNVSVGHASAAMHYVNPGESIQAAVNAADPGDTIIVRDGTYTENVDVNKQLIIRSENGPANCVIRAVNPNDHVFEVTADNVTINGFTVTGATGRSMAGIYLGGGVEYATISNNSISGNHRGVILSYSDNNTLSANNITSSDISTDGGMYPGIGIVLDHSNANSILDNTISFNNCMGIDFYFSAFNRILRNEISNNFAGIYMNRGSNNTISANNVTSNEQCLSFEGAGNVNNILYLNNFIRGRWSNFMAPDSRNTWNSPEEITYTYRGNTYTSYLGNYWNDYTGSDADGDGIGETPYSIGSDADNYPLMEPFENYVGGAPLDTTPPVWPEGSRLEASDITQTSLSLTWTAATDNVGVTAYRISCNGQQIAEVPGDVLNYQVTDLVPGTQYTFQVQAGDAAGNWSTDGPSVTATTQPPTEEAFLYFDPPQYHLTVGETVAVSLIVRNAVDLYGIDVQLHFDPAVVEVTPGGLTIGDIVAGLTVDTHTYFDNDTGLVRVVTSRRGDQYQEGFTGTGELFRVTFRGRAPDATSLSFGPVKLSDSQGQEISCTTEAGFIEVVPFVTVRGQVRLQGVRGYAGGVQLSLVDQTGREVASTTSSTDGNYEFSRTHDGNPIPPGTYRVIAVKTPGYLRAASPEFTVTGDIYEFELLPLELLAGDISGDNIVDIDDLLILRGAYDTIQGEENYHPAADLNANGKVDLFDLVLLARNYTKEGFAY